MFATKLIFLLGVAGCLAAPLDPEQNKLRADIQEALQPVAEQVRSLIDSEQAVAKDLTNEAQEAGVRVLQSAKSDPGIDRANIARSAVTRVEAVLHQAQAEIKGIGQRALADQRSAFQTVKSSQGGLKALRSLENKYLTADGQDLVRVLTKIPE